MSDVSNISNLRKRETKKGFIYNIKKYRQLYILLIPGIIFFLVFKYLPMIGIVIAFQEYQPWNGVKAIFTSPWIGFRNFYDFFTSGNFWEILRNSLSISFLKLLFGFPAPIILALLLNEVGKTGFKRLVQTITYLPYFLSWVIIYGILYNMFNVSYGAVNEIIKSMGGEPIAFLSEIKYFYPMVILSSIWQGVGFGTIIYLAGLTNIDQELYEAAEVDGCNRWQMTIHITIPSILPLCAVMLILTLGSLLTNDFQQLLILVGSNPITKQVGAVFETHAYEYGLVNGRFSYGTSVGLFQSFFGMILVITANRFARKIGYMGLY